MVVIDIYGTNKESSNNRGPAGMKLGALLVAKYILEHQIIDTKDRDTKLRLIEEELKQFKK